MTPSSIGQRIKCAMPKPLLCQTSMLSSERNNISDALHTPLVRTSLEESEPNDATTASIHSPHPDWQDLSLHAFRSPPGEPDCIGAFSVRVAVSSCVCEHCSA